MLQTLLGGVLLAYLLIRLWVVIKLCLFVAGIVAAVIFTWAMLSPPPRSAGRRDKC